MLCVADIVMIREDWFVGYFVGNTLWLVAIGYYLYITFLGYNGEYSTYILIGLENYYRRKKIELKVNYLAIL